MGKYGFFISNFAVSFISDVILNDLTNDRFNNNSYLNRIMSLKPYFNNKLITVSGIYAALTITLALIPVSLTTSYLFKIIYPKNIEELLKYCVVAFVYGYIIDILIDEFKLFGDTLDQYYQEFGRGFWGAAALLVSIIISYIINNFLIPVL